MLCFFVSGAGSKIQTITGSPGPVIVCMISDGPGIPGAGTI
jgi:hypothetical protein